MSEPYDPIPLLKKQRDYYELQVKAIQFITDGSFVLAKATLEQLINFNWKLKE